MNSFNDTVEVVAEDINSLLKRCDHINKIIEQLPNTNFIQLKIRETLLKQMNNSIAELFVLENMLQDVIRCSSIEDLKFMFDDSEE